MRSIALVVISVVFAFTSRVGNAQSEMRVWSDASGKFSIRATLVSADKDAATLKKADGSLIRVPLEKLNDSDRAYIRSVGQEPVIEKPPEVTTPTPADTSAIRPAANGKTDESKSTVAIKEAIALLESRKASAGDKNNTDRIDAAVAALSKLLPRNESTKRPVVTEPTPGLVVAMLKKKLGGKAVFKADTGELTLVYDFKTKNQLKDFDAADGKVTAGNGGILVNSAETLTHVVHFDTLTLTALVGVGNVGGNRSTILKTSAGAGLGAHTYNGIFVNLLLKEESVAEGLFVNPYGGEKVGLTLLVPVQFTVAKNRVGLKYGNTSLAKEIKDIRTGQVIFVGGPGGCQFRNITMSGKVDKDWMEEFLSK